MNQKVLILLLAVGTIIPQEAFCQWRFNARIVSERGQCNVIFVIAMESMVKNNNSLIFSNEEDCISARQWVAGMQTYEGCQINVVATPCTNPLNTINRENNSVTPYGYTQGQSNYSTNPANEIKDWDGQNKELMKLYGAWKENYQRETFDYIGPLPQTPHINHFIRADRLNPKDPYASRPSEGLSYDAIPVTQLYDGPTMPTGEPLVDKDDYELVSHLSPVRLGTHEPEPPDSIDYSDDPFIKDVDDVAEIIGSVTNLLYASKIGTEQALIMDFILTAASETVKANYKIWVCDDPYVTVSDIYNNTMNKIVSNLIGGLPENALEYADDKAKEHLGSNIGVGKYLRFKDVTIAFSNLFGRDRKQQ